MSTPEAIGQGPSAYPAAAIDTSAFAADQIKSIIERVERLNDELDGLKEDISNVYADAKGSGLDVKVLRKIIAIRRKDHDERQEEEATLSLYLSALGME